MLVLGTFVSSFLIIKPTKSALLFFQLYCSLIWFLIRVGYVAFTTPFFYFIFLSAIWLPHNQLWVIIEGTSYLTEF